MPKQGPNPNNPAPVEGFPLVCFLKNFITSPNIVVGDYTYYDDPDGPENFEKNVLYHFDFIGDRLIIGSYCAIAKNVTFIMNGANHQTTGFSTYPFFIFGNGWEKSAPQAGELPFKGNTVIGHDVWIGYDATIMPGVNIGSGSIIASKSVVTCDVAPYSVVGGNPAKVIKPRFDSNTISTLLDIAWWDWSNEKITAHLDAITQCDLSALIKLK